MSQIHHSALERLFCNKIFLPFFKLRQAMLLVTSQYGYENCSNECQDASRESYKVSVNGEAQDVVRISFVVWEFKCY